MVSKKVKIKRTIIAVVIVASILSFLWVYDYYDNVTVELPKNLENLINEELKEWKYSNMVIDVSDRVFTSVSHRVIKIDKQKDQTIVYGLFEIMSYTHNIVEEIKETKEYGIYADGSREWLKIYIKKDKQDKEYISDIWYSTGPDYEFKLMMEFPITTWSQLFISKDKYYEELYIESIQQFKDYIGNN